MFSDADAVGNTVFLAQDGRWSSSKGGKEYASLPFHEELALMLFACRDGKCCIYELIREGRPCRLYLDLEWVSSVMTVADAHRILSKVVIELHAFLQVGFSVLVRMVCFFALLCAVS
jgi:hypothetical protein